MKLKLSFFFFIVFAVCTYNLSYAQSVKQLSQKVDKLEKKVERLESRITILENKLLSGTQEPEL